MILKECLFIENDCYKANDKIKGKPTGIVVHSTGANNPALKRYVQPVESQSYYKDVIADIGLNAYNNSWNRPGVGKCCHAFIGKNLKGNIETYQTLPYDLCCWNCGTGTKGSYNYNPTAHIQFEICEDSLTDAVYFNAVMKEAQEYCAYLVKKFSLSVNDIVSHYEAKLQGYAGGNRVDIDHWLIAFNKDMDWFRSEVQKILDADKKVIYNVLVGEYSTKESAEQAAKQLKTVFKDVSVIERMII